MGTTSTVIARSSFLGTIEFFSNAVIGIMLMPFVIHSLGNTMYGLWILVGSFLGYYGLMDLGLNSAVQRYVARAVGGNDREEENRVVTTAFILFAFIGGAVLAVSVLLAAFVPMLLTNIPETGTFRTIILILGVNFAVGFPLRVFSGVLAAHIRYDLGTYVELAKLAARTVLVIALLKAGQGILALAVITALLDIGGYGVKYLLVRRLYPHVRIAKKHFSTGKAGTLFRYSAYSFVSQVADQLRLNSDNIVITACVGLAFVTPYSIGARMIRYFVSLVESSLGMFGPLFSQYEAAKRNDLIIEKLLFITKIGGYVSFLIGGMLLMFGRAFIERWMGREYAVSFTVLAVLAVPTMIALMQTSSVQLLYGLSRHKFYAVTNVAEGIASVLLSILFAQKWGIAGIAFGFALPLAVTRMFVQPLYVCRTVGLSPLSYYRRAVIPVTIKAAAVLGLLWMSFRNYVLPEYPRLALLAGFSVAAYAGVIGLTGFSAEEKRNIRNAAIRAVFSRNVAVKGAPAE